MNQIIKDTIIFLSFCIAVIVGFYTIYEQSISNISDVYNHDKSYDANIKNAIVSGFFYGMVYQEATHILNQSIIYESNNSGIINCFNNQSENETNMTLCLNYALQDMKNGVSS